MPNDIRAKIPIARCPDCRERIRLSGKLYVGKTIICSNCDAELEVIDIDPLELDWASDGNDYDDYDEEER